MSVLRSQVLCWGAVLSCVPLHLSAQNFPTKSVRIICGFSAGSATDITSRMVAPKFSEFWGHPVVVENRPGAGSTLASVAAAKATPDGHTILLVSGSFAINAVLPAKPAYDPLKEFIPVAQIGASTGVLVVAPSLGIKSVKELIALAQERPGKILFGSAGAGSGLHMTAERFRMAAGIKTVHVGFKGQPEMIIEIMSGRVHYGMPGLGPSLHLIKDGKLTALGVMSVTNQRAPVLPDVPAMIEVMPNFERDAAHGILVPAGTPRAIVNKIAKDLARALEAPDVKQQMNAISFVAGYAGPEEYAKIIRQQLAIFEKVARAAGLKG